MLRKPKIIKVKKNCTFCHNHLEADYKDVNALRKYVSERGKIVGKNRTGVCTKHQKRLAVAIKRARFLALLPFTGGL